MTNRYKKHRDEKIIAWLVTLVLLALLGTGIYFAVKFLKDPVSDKVSSILAPKDAQPEEAEEEEEAEEAYTGSGEDEGLDEESLSAIFDKEEEEEEEEKEEDAEDPLLDEASKLVEKMTLQQKVAQLFFVEPESITGVEVATAAGEKTRLALEERPVGGVIFSKKNIESAEQLKTMNENLQRFSDETAGVPLFIAVEEEGGSVTCLAGSEAFTTAEEDASSEETEESASSEESEEGAEAENDTEAEDDAARPELKTVPAMSEIGAGKEKDAYKAGNTIGTYLKEYGFNLDFAPVADVSEDGVKNALGDRIFSSDPEVCAGMVSSYLSGLHDAGVLGCPGHFPGLGGVEEDGSDGPVVTEKDWGDLKERDLIPFERAIDEKVKFIMVSHLSVPQVTGDEIPASLSGIILTEKLRLDMGYTGVIITDALDKGAVKDSYDSGDAALAALKAGADMLLMPGNLNAAYDSILAAVEDGSVSEERIAESARRIVYVKLFLKENG